MNQSAQSPEAIPSRGQDGGQAAVPDLRVEPFQRETGTAGRAEVRGMTGMQGTGRCSGSRPVSGSAHRNHGPGGRLYSGVFHGAGKPSGSGRGVFPASLYCQKYMNKVFTPRDCQVFAYLYEGLSMSSELLEYLVEYCVQNGHISVRYMEDRGHELA